MGSLQDDAVRVEALGVLSRFRAGLYECLTARADALFELADGAPRSTAVPDKGERRSISPSS